MHTWTVWCLCSTTAPITAPDDEARTEVLQPHIKRIFHFTPDVHQCIERNVVFTADFQQILNECLV